MVVAARGRTARALGRGAALASALAALASARDARGQQVQPPQRPPQQPQPRPQQDGRDGDVVAPIRIEAEPPGAQRAPARPADDPETPGRLPPPPPDDPAAVQPPRPPRRNQVVVQPISLAWATIDLEYERAFGRYVSVYVAGSLVPGRRTARGGAVSYYVYGVAADLGLRVFPLGRAPSGFFVAGSVGLTSFYDDLFARTQGLGFRTGPSVGYTLVVLEHLVVSAGLGIELLSFTRGTYTRLSLAGTMRAALGFAF